MWKRTVEILRKIKNKDLLILLKQFIGDPEFVAAYKRSPAAVSFHHAYIGGLMEHTLSLLETGAAILPLYPQAQRGRGAGGAVPARCRQDQGTVSQRRIRVHGRGAAGRAHRAGDDLDRAEGRSRPRRSAAGKFPTDLKCVLQHIVLSHHGEYEYGSPKLPAMAEAAMVHYIDVMDAKVQAFCAAVDGCHDDDSHWTEWVRSLNTRVYRFDGAGGSASAAALPLPPLRLGQ